MRKAGVIVADGSHPAEGMMQMPLIPFAGSFNEKMDANMPDAWWMAFNQVKEFPEILLEGRFHFLVDWLFNYMMIDAAKMTPFERNLYASVYNDTASIRSSNAWYQTLTQDIEDAETYQQLTVPVLGIGSYVSYNYMKMGLPYVATNLTVTGILNSGHYMFEEQPQLVLQAILPFLSS